MKNKKGTSLSMETVVIFLIIIIVFVVIMLIFTGQFNKLYGAIKNFVDAVVDPAKNMFN